MRIQLSSDKKTTGKPLQRKPIPDNMDNVLQTPGQHIPPDTLNYMQSRLGHSFNDVKVHDDTSAAQSAASVHARAYTMGNHIVFNKDNYNPATTSGQKLLAHELTHVHQQHAHPMFDLEEKSSGTADAQEAEAVASEDKVDTDDSDKYFEDEPGLEGDAPHLSDEEIAAIIAETSSESAAEEEEEADVFAGSGISLGVAGLGLSALNTAGEDSLFGLPGEAGEMGDKKAPKKDTAKKDPPKKDAPKKDAPKKDAPPAEKGKRIVVDLGKQTATALEDGKPVKSLPISSGKATHPTTPGKFKIGERDIDHKSNKYGKCVDGKGGEKDSSKGAAGCGKGETYKGAPMKYFQRFNGGEGFHKGKLPGHPDSHGCVRLSEDSAKWLWDWAEPGTPVHVSKGAAPKKKAPPKAPPKKPAPPKKK